MRHVVRVVAVVMTLLVGAPGQGPVRAAPAETTGSFDEGLAAYRAGDFESARRIWLPLAERGDVVAQNNLGAMADVDGPAHDPATAASWYGKAAAGGYAVAQHNLAVMYEKGHGVAQDYALARRWYGVAAAQGDAEAMTNLGLMQYRGQGGKKDPKAAVETFTRAAKLGSVKAAYDLGTLLEHGDGVAADPAAAASWFRQAADANYAPAQSSLGLLYAKGDGVKSGFRGGD